MLADGLKRAVSKFTIDAMVKIRNEALSSAKNSKNS